MLRQHLTCSISNHCGTFCVRQIAEYEEGSDLLWPSDKEDKITRQFYKDLSNLSKNINYSKKKKLKLFEQVVRIIKGKGWG